MANVHRHDGRGPEPLLLADVGHADELRTGDFPSLAQALPQQDENASSPHERLPDDVLRHIFVITVQEYGFVRFPLSLNKPPIPQLALTHVCSHWRNLAIHSFELWNNIRFSRFYPDVHYHSGQDLQEWRLRAGNSTVALSLGSIPWSKGGDNVSANIIRRTVLPFKAKVLHLDLSTGQFMALLKLPDSVLSDVENLRLWLGPGDLDKNFGPARNFDRLRSVTINGICGSSVEPKPVASVELFSLPWHQLRCLVVSFDKTISIPIITILQQIPMLQSLKLDFLPHQQHPLCHSEKLIMPRLHTMALDYHLEIFDEVICHFVCPVLTNLRLTGRASWTDETFEIIKRQYNMQGLVEIEFSRCHLPISVILRSAPQLRVLVVDFWRNMTLDDDAITGISDGILGRHLRTLFIQPLDFSLNLTEVVERGKITVVTAKNRGWPQSDSDWKRMNDLKEAGIHFITLPL